MRAGLDTALKDVPGLASGHVKKIDNLGISTIKDLLCYLPRKYEDRSRKNIGELRAGDVVGIAGFVRNIKARRLGGRRTVLNALIEDDTGRIPVAWFNQDYLTKMIGDGDYLELFGTVKRGFKGGVSFQPKGRPEIIKDGMAVAGDVAKLTPVYPLTTGVTNDWFREKIAKFISLLSKIDDPLPKKIIKDHKLLDLAEALKEIHIPTDADKLEAAKHRIGFDELFYVQLASLQQKAFWKSDAAGSATAFPMPVDEIRKFTDSLPFKLTDAQRKSAYEILQDMESTVPMLRLLEGDVGSGKTMVAALAILSVISQGSQAALLAPTEVLARQHLASLVKYFAPLGKNIQLLVGSVPQGERKKIFQGLLQGTVDVLVGTHAILEETVKYNHLGLAVVDEQHRFGVKQRSILRKQGTPHLLAMTATPIPRTMALTIYGDQDLSILDEMPAGRKPIQTRVVTDKDRGKAAQFVKQQIAAGRQAFVICPLIDENPRMEVKSVKAEYEYLKKEIYPELNIGLLHGKMKPKEKDAIMKSFAARDIDILVSTSVIEVGIDIPNASLMIIEGAERFGLAQLHQFRGRVGRGEHRSFCLLFASKGVDTESMVRLQAMERESSGFKLAELDLKLRGPGEVFGTRQSGIPDLRMASLFDRELVEETRAAANSLLEEDPKLTKYPLLAERIAKNTEERN